MRSGGSVLLSGLGSAALLARGVGTSIPSPAGGLRAVGLSFTDFRATNQVKSVVQEPDLEFEREGSHDRILGDAAHLSIMRHNFSNVVT